MTRSISLLLALCATVLLFACSEQKPPAKVETKADEEPAVAPAASAATIHDGIGVGRIELGMTLAEVEARHGAPIDTNKAGDRVVYMSYHASEIFGVYFNDDGRVRMIIAAMKDGTWCTAYDVCLYREGDLAKLKAHHGDKLLRFVDRDGSVTYRLLEAKGVTQVMTEYTPVEEKNGVVQVAILFWTGPIDRSSFD